jgi:hypothetical protein
MPGCPFRVLPWWERLPLAAVVAGVILAKPFLNAIGVDLNQEIASANVVLRWSAVVPVLVWLGAIYLAWKEPSDHHWTTAINAMGAPGTLLGLAVAFSKG